MALRPTPLADFDPTAVAAASITVTAARAGIADHAAAATTTTSDPNAKEHR